jgi:hypothetical protein
MVFFGIFGVYWYIWYLWHFLVLNTAFVLAVFGIKYRFCPARHFILGRVSKNFLFFRCIEPPHVLISEELDSLRPHVLISSNFFRIKILPRPTQEVAS